MNVKGKENYGFWAFLPLLVFLMVYFGGGLIYMCLGTPDPFDKIPMVIALLIGIGTTFFMGKGTLDEKMERLAVSAGQPNIIVMCFIYLLAGAFAGVTSGIGGVQATVNFGLTFIPVKFIIAGLFIISCFISLAMGTSMGTAAAIAPIAVGVCNATGANPALALGAVVGGAMFGDNLSIISDTSIAACQGMGCHPKEKFKMNFLIALPAAIITIIILVIQGTEGGMSGPYPYEFIKMLPYIVVLGTALMGMNVFIVLIMGTLLSSIIGIVTGTVSVAELLASMAGGVSGMQGIVITSLSIAAMAGVAQKLGGIEWAVNVFTNKIKSQKGAELSVAALVALIDGALGNNTVAIIVSLPLARKIASIYDISGRRIASLLDIFSCSIQGLTIHGGQLLVAATFANLSPVALMPYSYYQILLGLAGLVTIFFVKTKKGSEVGEVISENEVI